MIILLPKPMILKILLSLMGGPGGSGTISSSPFSGGVHFERAGRDHHNKLRNKIRRDHFVRRKSNVENHHRNGWLILVLEQQRVLPVEGLAEGFLEQSALRH